jgi:hypothetical protein
MRSLKHPKTAANNPSVGQGALQGEIARAPCETEHSCNEVSTAARCEGASIPSSSSFLVIRFPLLLAHSFGHGSGHDFTVLLNHT